MASDPTPVLVHGNPETAAIWRPLVAALAERGVEDVVALSPPGFGAPLPDGFAATPDAYLDWLVAEITAIGHPVDVVGHDWGAGHVYRLAAERPDLVRSWAADIAGLLHPDYEWHEAALTWQQPGAGEEAIAMMVGLPEDDRIAVLVGLGLTGDVAADVAAAMDEAMGGAILALYRAAAQPYPSQLGERLRATQAGPDGRPGLVITASDDAYVAADLARHVAGFDHVGEVVLDGHGHWWMMSAPDEAADALVTFWSRR